MDGSEAVKMITDGLVWPNSLANDYLDDYRYWTDTYLGHIEQVCAFNQFLKMNKYYLLKILIKNKKLSRTRMNYAVIQ